MAEELAARPERAGPPFATPAELAPWLRAHGLDHLQHVALGVLAPGIDEALRPQFRSATHGRRLLELATVQGIEAWVKRALPSPRMRALLPERVGALLEGERRHIEAARATPALPRTPPPDSRREKVFRHLQALRATLPADLAPIPESALRLETLELVPDLPGFRTREPEWPEVSVNHPWGFLVPEVELRFSPEAAEGRCNCGRPGCRHILRAVELALTWLEQPWSEDLGRALEDLLRPPWGRVLLALERIFQPPPREAEAEVGWHLEVIDGFGIEVTAHVRRRRRNGELKRGPRLNRRLLLEDAQERLSLVDARIAALLPGDGEPASQALLKALVGHERLFWAETTERVQVDLSQVGIVAEDRGGSVVVTVGVDGAALPAPLVARIRRTRPEEALYLWEADPRRLTVLEVRREIRELLIVLGRQGSEFPPESHAALVERLSQISARLPVALPRSVMGTSLPTHYTPVLRLQGLPGGQVRMELRTRPLPDAASVVPGEGPRDVFARRAEGSVHAVRDLALEVTDARALQIRLPLAGAEALPEPFAFVFPSAQGALAVLADVERLTPRPELEWQEAAPRLMSSRVPPVLKVALRKRRDWFGVLGGLSLKGERVELARLLEAARRKERFVLVAGDRYLEIEKALRQHLERLSDHVHATRHGLEVGPSAVEAVAALEEGGAKVDVDDAWASLARNIFAAQELRPSPPRSLKTGLRDYQAEGFRWLIRLASWGAGAVLADDMGLGKTVQALAVLLERRKLGPALVVAPTSVAFNWRDEAKRFAPGLRLHLYGEVADRGGALERLKANDVLVVSYGLLSQDTERLAALRFSTIVFDEAQLLKNASTQRFKAARALQGDFKLALSGTPFENHLGELWSVFAVVFPGLLGSWEGFRTRFASPIERGTDPTAAPALARVLQPFLLRRTKQQVERQLPPRTDVRVPVVLSSGEWQLYEDARLTALASVESKASEKKEHERRIEILAALTRLRLLASNPKLFDANCTLPSAKLERFLELVTELAAEGQRTLVFSQFTSHLALVRGALERAGMAYEYLDGQTPQRERPVRVRAFQEGTAPLFLISLKAGGFGLNLTAATSVIHLDPWWNPAVEDQASDRAHRIGQSQPVTVYRLIARGTIEEQMLSLHEQKRALVTGVLEGKDVAGRLSVRELLALLANRLAPVEGASTPPDELH